MERIPILDVLMGRYLENSERSGSSVDVSSSSQQRSQESTSSSPTRGSRVSTQESTSSSPPQQSHIRPPPGFPAVPQHAPIRSHSSPPPPNAINTSRPPPATRHFKIIELCWGEHTPSHYTTAFLLLDTTTGGLFHGTLPCRPWLRSFLSSGLSVTDFRVGNQPILPVNDTYLWPRYSDDWLQYNPDLDPEMPVDTTARVKRPTILLRREFEFHYPGVADRLRSEISVCERVRRRPCPNLAEYMGVEVDEWERVTGVAYKRYPVTLRDFARPGYLCKRHIPIILRALVKAVWHLWALGVSYGVVAPENVYIVFGWWRGEVYLREIVLGNFEHAIVRDERVGRKEEVLMKVDKETVWLGRVFKVEEEQVFEVECVPYMHAEFKSLTHIRYWMNDILR